MRTSFIILICYFSSFLLNGQERLDGKTHPFQLEIGQLKNAHEINEEIYRSDQPSKKDFLELERMGIRTVISLRRRVDDAKKVKSTAIRLIQIPVKTNHITLENVIEVMNAMTTCERPLLIHCRRGIDRTGCMIAFYRMLFHGWSKEQAIAEFISDDYGYSEKLFPGILKFLQDVDIRKLEERLN